VRSTLGAASVNDGVRDFCEDSCLESLAQFPKVRAVRLALGDRGATFIAIAIAISALGFLSQGMLTAPRVYFAMAEDGLFFGSVAAVSATTRVPVVAIVLQGVAAAVIALSGTFGPRSRGFRLSPRGSGPAMLEA